MLAQRTKGRQGAWAEVEGIEPPCTVLETAALPLRHTPRCQIGALAGPERVTGFEPVSSAWKTEVLGRYTTLACESPDAGLLIARTAGKRS